MSLTSLAKIFKLPKNYLIKQCVASEIINWSEDPFAKGAYSYSTPQTKKACIELTKPIQNRLFFAGEALDENARAIVEGALASGRDVAKKINKQ